MSKQCPHCGGQKFRAKQKLYVDVIVDENNTFLSNDMIPDTELSINQVDSPYGPYQCVGCDTVFDDLDEQLSDFEEEQPPKPEPTHRASCHCSVIVVHDGVVYHNDLITGDDFNDVARLAEERAVQLCLEIGRTDINDPDIRSDFIMDGYIEHQGRAVMISWPEVTDVD